MQSCYVNYIVISHRDTFAIISRFVKMWLNLWITHYVTKLMKNIRKWKMFEPTRRSSTLYLNRFSFGSYFLRKRDFFHITMASRAAGTSRFIPISEIRYAHMFEEVTSRSYTNKRSNEASASTESPGCDRWQKEYSTAPVYTWRAK